MDKKNIQLTTGGIYHSGDVMAFSVDPATGDITLSPLGKHATVVIRQRDWLTLRNTVDEEHAAIAEKHGG